MLSRSQARNFFVIGTTVCVLAFLGLTIDTFNRIPAQTREENLSPAVIHGKELWERSNCMGCHTLLGEGAYYAPELTKVWSRRGPQFIRAMITDPEAMYPGRRKMQRYEFTEEEMQSLLAFFEWIDGMDLNGWPPVPHLMPVAVPAGDAPIANRVAQPKVYNQMCIACHVLNGQGGPVGPALDNIGDRKNYNELVAWLRDPQKIKPGTTMPKLPLSESDIAELAAYLSQFKSSGEPAEPIGIHSPPADAPPQTQQPPQL